MFGFANYAIFCRIVIRYHARAATQPETEAKRSRAPLSIYSSRSLKAYAFFKNAIAFFLSSANTAKNTKL